jgi:hypothetical protein
MQGYLAVVMRCLSMYPLVRVDRLLCDTARVAWFDLRWYPMIARSWRGAKTSAAAGSAALLGVQD